MRRRTITIASCLVAATGFAACGGDDNPPSPGSDMPTEVTMVASGDFDTPLDAVASPDGSTFYFTAYTLGDEPKAALFSVPAAGGSATLLHAGAPLAFPSGLVMSCDGSTLLLADASISSDDEDDDDDIDDSAGGLYSVDVSSGTLTALDAPGVASPSGLALSPDCVTLYATGETVDGEGALFRMPLEGGSAEVVYQGAPLMSPTGMYVDGDEVAWVLDHVGDDGDGVLYAIDEEGSLSTVVEGLALGAVGGCSLDAAGGTAFMPTTDDDDASGLTTVSLATGEEGRVQTPGVVEPSGLRTARDAAVFALVDHEGSAIFRAQ